MGTHHLTPGRNALRKIIQAIIGLGILAALLFIPAGRLDWWMAWIMIGAYMTTVYVGVAFLQKSDPELVAERQQVKEDVKTWDKVITTLFSLVFIPLILITSGLDQRFGWTAPFPLAIQILALLMGMICFALIFWGMAANTHFESYVRIQADREHQTITNGPYQYVRHPGYLGMALSTLVLPLILGSWWALIPGGCATTLIVIRTALEDKTLQAELPGYAEYAQRTRYRLLPGIW
jgi:protein-S-isoprenylcysteine O-methyltransferase Ste14